MPVADKNIIPPPFELWLTDFTDLALPRKPDGRCYTDKHDFDAYLDWLVDHLDVNQLPLAPHQKEILSAPNIADWEAGRLGLFLGGAAISEFYFFGQPQFDYPADFLSDPRPERVCNPETVEIDSRLMKNDYDRPQEEDRWALTLE
jgi:hypothetical protein